MSLRELLARAFRLVTFLAIGLLLVVVATFVVNAVYFTPRLRTTSAMLAAVQRAHVGMIDQETGIRGFLLADPTLSQQFLGPYRQGRATTTTNLAEATELARGDPNLSARVIEMSDRANDWESNWAEAAAHNRSLALDSAFLSRGKTLFDAYRLVESVLIGTLSSQLSYTLRRQGELLGVGLVLAILLTLGLVLVMVRQRRQLLGAVARPIGRLATVVHRIRDGDLSATVDSAGNGGRPVAAEIASLSTDVADMGRSLAARDAALVRNQHLLIDAQRLAALGSWEYELDTRSTRWTPEMYRIWGFDPAGPPPTLAERMTLVYEADRDRLADLIDAVTRTGQPGEVSYRMTRDGAVHYLDSRIEAETDDDGRTVRLTGTSQDVTERSLAQRALEESESRYRLLAQHSTDMISRHDPTGRYLYASAAARSLLGREPEDMVGVDPYTQIHPDDIPEVTRAQQRQLDGDAGARVTYRLWHADGHWIWVESLASAVRGRDGELQEIQVTTRDVSAERQAAADKAEAARAMAEARDAALQATAAKSGFLAAMSHEIRTPMNAIVGMADLMRETDLDPDQHQFVDTIRASADVLLSVINNILDFSKIESGALELEREPFDLRDCVEGVAELLGPAATAKHIDLICHLAPECPGRVLGDITRLRQVLLNLMSNAVKFTSDGEVLMTVRVAGRRPDDAVELEFTVRDTGAGIPPDSMGRLFKSFSQVDASTARTHGGTGLGLAISQRLVQAMGGIITVASEVGTGSTFSFTVPFAAHGLGASVAASDQRDLGVLTGKSAVIIDDNDTNRHIQRLQLEGWGMTCVDFASPLPALDYLLGDDRYDVVLLDMQMPELTGDQLAGEYLSRTTRPPVPLVMLASMGTPLPRSSRHRYAAMLSKPLRSAILRQTLANALAPPTALPADEPAADEPPAPDALRILIAEDNPTNQRVAQLMLRKLGYPADAAMDGRAAVDAVHRQPYDVVLMDVQMPEMDGLTATRAIRAELPAEDQPYIVGLSAGAFTEDRHAGLEAGMDDFLTKPVRKAALTEALDRAASLRSG